MMGEMIKKKRRREDEEKVRRGKDAGGGKGTRRGRMSAPVVF